MKFFNLKTLSGILLLTLGLAFSTPLPCATAKTIKIASDADYEPFSYTDAQGQPAGFDVDIAKALCAEMNKDCEIVLMSFDEIMPALIKGDVDVAVAGLAMTPDRQESVDFTDRYYRSHSIFVQRAGSFKDTKPESLKGKKAGAQVDTIQENYIRKMYGDNIEIVTEQIFEDLFKDLHNGKVDIVFADGLPAYAMLKTSLGEGLEPVGMPVSPSSAQANSHIAVTKKDPGLRDELNKALQGILRNGEYDRINRKYFDFNIY